MLILSLFYAMKLDFCDNFRKFINLENFYIIGHTVFSRNPRRPERVIWELFLFLLRHLRTLNPASRGIWELSTPLLSTYRKVIHQYQRVVVLVQLNKAVLDEVVLALGEIPLALDRAAWILTITLLTSVKLKILLDSVQTLIVLSKWQVLDKVQQLLDKVSLLLLDEIQIQGQLALDQVLALKMSGNENSW